MGIKFVHFRPAICFGERVVIEYICITVSSLIDVQEGGTIPCPADAQHLQTNPLPAPRRRDPSNQRKEGTT